MFRALLVVLGLTMLIGLVMSEEPLEVRSNGIQFSFEDSVSGSGNFASNNKLVAQGPHANPRVLERLADVVLQEKNHGSGSIERDAVINSNKLIKIQIEPDVIYAYGLIAVLDNHSMVYASQAIPIGKGYYATHPVKFNSLLGDSAQIKNYASETSMGHEIEQAHAVNMDLMAKVEDDHSGWNPSKGLARTLMNLDGGITSGSARIKMLQGDTSGVDRIGKVASHNPNIDVEEDYTGTFDIVTKMNLTLPVTKIVSGDSWLPCCSGGWVDMMNPDKKAFGVDAKGIFDCTCPKEYLGAKNLKGI